jgi:hypothetical protein
MRACLGKVTKGWATCSRLHFAVLWIMLLFGGVPVARPQSPDLLPGSLYLIREDDQIWCMEVDGEMLTQIAGDVGLTNHLYLLILMAGWYYPHL